jgi:hypothetical protein
MTGSPEQPVARTARAAVVTAGEARTLRAALLALVALGLFAAGLVATTYGALSIPDHVFAYAVPALAVGAGVVAWGVVHVLVRAGVPRGVARTVALTSYAGVLGGLVLAVRILEAVEALTASTT